MERAPQLRKLVVQLETVHHDGGPRLEQPLLRGVCAAVIANPHAGRYVPDLTEWM